MVRTLGLKKQFQLACILCLIAATGIELADAYSLDINIASFLRKGVYDPTCKKQPGELKHLSNQKKRKQKQFP